MQVGPALEHIGLQQQLCLAGRRVCIFGSACAACKWGRVWWLAAESSRRLGGCCGAVLCSSIQWRLMQQPSGDCCCSCILAGREPGGKRGCVLAGSELGGGDGTFWQAVSGW
eukprot:225101-Chlamydomonas_euryale.AAC.7